jgi:hypothetical protein
VLSQLLDTAVVPHVDKGLGRGHAQVVLKWNLQLFHLRWEKPDVFILVPDLGRPHGGALRTMNCRLCINCYGTG